MKSRAVVGSGKWGHIVAAAVVTALLALAGCNEHRAEGRNPEPRAGRNVADPGATAVPAVAQAARPLLQVRQERREAARHPERAGTRLRGRYWQQMTGVLSGPQREQIRRS